MPVHQILVIEEGDGLTRTLKSGGLEPLRAHSFQDVLQRFYSASFSLIISDKMLATEEGFYVCENMRMMKPDLPVIFVGDDDLKEEVAGEMHNYFVSVPFHKEDLFSVIDRAIGQPEVIDLSGMESQAASPIPPEVDETTPLHPQSSPVLISTPPNPSISDYSVDLHPSHQISRSSNLDPYQRVTIQSISSPMQPAPEKEDFDDPLSDLVNLDLFNSGSDPLLDESLIAHDLIDDEDDDLLLSEEVLFSNEILPGDVEKVISAPPAQNDPSYESLVDYEQGLIIDINDNDFLRSAYKLEPMRSTDQSEPQGLYGEITFPELLFRCFDKLFTGRLLLRRDRVKHEIFFSSGQTIEIKTNLITETLPGILKDQGQIDEFTYQKLINQHNTHKKASFQELIKAMGILDEAALHALKQAQVRRVVASCFTWERGAYGMNYDPDIQRRARSGHPLSPLLLLFEGIKTALPITLLIQHFDEHMRRPIQRTSKINDYATMLRSFAEELKLTSLCDGERTLGELLALSPHGLIDTLRIIRALEIASCVSFGEARAPADLTEASAGGPRRRARPAAGLAASLAAAGLAAPAAGHAARSGANRPLPSRPAQTKPALRGVSSPKAPPRAKPERRPVGSKRPPPAAQKRRPQASAPQVDNIEDFVNLKYSEINSKNYYDFIGLARDAHLNQIKERYDYLMRALSEVGKTKNIPLIKKAGLVSKHLVIIFDVLSNKDKRDKYWALSLEVSPAQGLDVVLAERNFKFGKICLESAEYIKASEFFSVARQQDPHQPLYGAFESYCLILEAPKHEKKQRADLLEGMKEALKEDETLDEVAVLIGNIYRDANNPDQAIRFYQRALSSNAGNRDARRALADLQDDDDEEMEHGSLFGRLFSKPKR